MYFLLFAFLFSFGLWLIYLGWPGRRLLLLTGSMVLVGGIALALLTGLWGEALWFHALGYGDRFWTLLMVQTAAIFAGAALAAFGIYLLSGTSARTISGQWSLGYWPELLGALVGGFWGWRSWDELLLFANRVGTGISEPIFNQDSGFYLFVLPLLDRLHDLAVLIVVISLLIAFAIIFVQRGNAAGEFRLQAPDKNTGNIYFSRLRPFWLSLAALALVLALGRVLDSFHLLYSSHGVVTGPGWTDVHVRLPAYWLLALLLLLTGSMPLIPTVRRSMIRRLQNIAPSYSPGLSAAALLWGTTGVVWLLALGVTPTLLQGVLVEPNEITYEKPYISNNIRFTRYGFRLHEVEEQQFPVSEMFNRKVADNNRSLLNNIRLWDWRALDAVYKQFQEIRLYYEFNDVDVDRYHIGDDYRQVMISAREMAQDNLARQSQTFVNRRFKFTHGYGLTLTPVSDFNAQGLPELLIRDIPPKSVASDLSIEQPRIYYGELTDDPVVVNSSEREFDYPSGDKNVYNHYAGEGGVRLTNLWRKFLFGWKFDGTKFLLSSYPNADSRVMFHRQISERVKTLAPFLTLDQDPYPVLAAGRLYWMIDAYTTSRYYPYSEPFASRETIEYENDDRRSQLGNIVLPDLDGVNYLRNSVKVVVDAYQGSVDFYVFEPEDPLIQAWSGAFPDLFKPAAALSDELRAHVRYPTGLLLAQGLVYSKYHMDDPAVFYNQEDLWVRATEKYYSAVQPVEPYYVMWQLPKSQQPEFVQILPFTPKNRQVLIGWIAGLSDGDNYGRFLAYKFPKEKRILGPQQVETKIDQDRFLSGQLTLWDQRGSNVIRGNVLAIPIADTLLYVEPIYLQAETAAYPELRLVVLMHGDDLSYAETFDEALLGLFSGQKPEQFTSIPGTSETRPVTEESLRELAQQASQAFENYLRLQAEKRFQAAAEQLTTLQDRLQRMAGQNTPAESSRKTVQPNAREQLSQRPEYNSDSLINKE